jgi:hypothetical protein
LLIGDVSYILCQKMRFHIHPYTSQRLKMCQDEMLGPEADDE